MRTAMAMCKIPVRCLLRRKRDLQQESAPLNELVFTDEHFYVAAKAYRRKCNIRIFNSDENVTMIIMDVDYSSCHHKCWFLPRRVGSDDTARTRTVTAMDT